MAKRETTPKKAETKKPAPKKSLINKAEPLSDDQLGTVAGGVAASSGPTVGFDGTRTNYGGGVRGTQGRTPGVDTRDCD